MEIRLAGKIARPTGNFAIVRAAISRLWSQSLNRITFDGRGGAKAAERRKVGRRIRDVEERSRCSLWMLEDASAGVLIQVTPLAPQMKQRVERVLLRRRSAPRILAVDLL